MTDPQRDNVVVEFKKLQSKAAEEPKDHGGHGGGDGGSMADDDRIKGIEARLDSIETEQKNHFRWTMTVGVSLVALVIAVLSVTVSGGSLLLGRLDRTEDKIVRLDEKVSGVNDRINRLEVSIGELPTKVNGSLMQLNQTLLQAVIAGSTQRPVPAPETPQAPHASAPK